MTGSSNYVADVCKPLGREIRFVFFGGYSYVWFVQLFRIQWTFISNLKPILGYGLALIGAKTEIEF